MSCADAFLGDLARWVGVAVGVLGAVVVAPSGFRLTLDRARQGARRTRALLGRVIPWLRPRPQVIRVGGAVSMSAAGSVTVATAHGWEPGASVEAKIERLRRQLGDLADQVGRLEGALHSERQQRAEAIEAAARELREEVAGLRETVEQQQRRGAEVDARGLPLIAAGVVLTGIDEEVACWPTWLGWAVIGGAVLITLLVLAGVIGRLRGSREDAPQG